MAANTFQCTLITPEAKVLDEAVTAAVVPLWDGQMGFLPSRAPIVGQLGVGELRVDTAGGSKSFLIDDGFAQMLENRLTILAAKATPADKVNEAEIQAELAEANARKTEGLVGPDLEKVRNDRQKAAARLRTARSMKTGSR